MLLHHFADGDNNLYIPRSKQKSERGDYMDKPISYDTIKKNKALTEFLEDEKCRDTSQK